MYYGLIKATLTKRKITMNNTANHNRNATADSIAITTMLATCAAYSSLLNKITVPPTCEKMILNCRFTKDSIHHAYLLPFTVAKQTKLIAFQYKIIHNVLRNQASLFCTGRTKNNTCPLCNCEQQTTSRMLFNCVKSTAFWDSFVKW